MGYTHYYKTDANLNQENFNKVINNFKKCMPIFEQLGIKLAGPMGSGKPKINKNVLAFNGDEKCGHQERDLGITWPADTAKGLSMGSFEEKFKQDMDKKLESISSNGVVSVLIGNPLEWVKHSDVKKAWFAGAQLEARTCGGDCSHESFYLEIKKNKESEPIGEVAYIKADGSPVKNNPKSVGKHFNFTKTAYKPYDLAVNVALIIAKHHLGDQIIVSSDGKQQHWVEGMFICQKILGYGKDFKINEDD